MKKIYYILFLGFGLTLFSSCEKDETIGGTATQEMAGDWVVHIVGSDGYEGDAVLSTYNTAKNVPTEMFLEDQGSFWPMKGKVSVNAANFTFTGENIANEYDDEDPFAISEGKILKDAATAPGSKSKTDSIYFQAIFSSDAVIYTFSGYKRTGFPEDDL